MDIVASTTSSAFWNRKLNHLQIYEGSVIGDKISKYRVGEEECILNEDTGGMQVIKI